MKVDFWDVMRNLGIEEWNDVGIMDDVEEEFFNGPNGLEFSKIIGNENYKWSDGQI